MPSQNTTGAGHLVPFLDHCRCRMQVLSLLQSDLELPASHLVLIPVYLPYRLNRLIVINTLVPPRELARLPDHFLV